jgi:hypothetical protein
MIKLLGIVRVMLISVFLLPLGSCSGGGENEWKTIYLKMGVNMLEWQAMQTEAELDVKSYAYLTSPELRGNFKVYIDDGVWLEIPHAIASLIVEAGRITDISIMTWQPYGKWDKSPQKANALLDKAKIALNNSRSWELRPFPGAPEGLEAWFRRDKLVNQKGVGEYIELGVSGSGRSLGENYQFHFLHSPNDRIRGCLSGINTHFEVFDNRFKKVPEYPTPRYVTGYLQSRAANSKNSSNDILLALEIMGAEDPQKLPMDEYLRRVDRYMEKVCPDMLDRYGRFQEPKVDLNDER